MYNLEEIQNQFNEVIRWSQGIAEPQSDSLFKEWEKNKKWFIDRAQGNLIVNCGPVSFNLDDKTKNLRISEFLDTIDLEYHLYDLTNFIDEQRDTFYNNETCKEYIYHNIKIPKGSKLVKAFKHFISNKELLTEIQNRASMLIQDDKIHGELCFSVHPLDYLSISENTYKWRSCHALDGEYRAGNLSYMGDKSTVVCYLKGEDNKKLPHFPNEVKWNSKKWRCLLFFSDSTKEIFYGRQYPMFSQEAMTLINFRLQEAKIIGTEYWSPPYCDYIESLQGDTGYWGFATKYYPIRNRLFGIHDIIKDQSDLYFNDLLRSSCYIPYITAADWDYGEKIQFNIGYEAKCLSCGEHEIHPGDNGSMLCKNCGGDNWDSRTYWCDYCNDSHDEDDMYFIDGLCICENCLPKRTISCDFCGGIHLKQNSRYDDDSGKHFCSNYCFTQWVKQNNKEENSNGEGTDSQEQDSREVERSFRIELPW